MKVEFSTQSGRDGVNPSAQTGRLINCYREPLIPGGKSAYQIRATYGMAEIADLDRVFLRALMPWQGGMMAICGGVLDTITTAGAVTTIGTVGESEYAGISANTGYATIVSDGRYWHYDGTTLTEVAFDYDLGSVCYIGGYTVVTEKGGRRFAWSDPADPTTFDGLSFASAEITDDPLIRGVVVKDVLLLFKASGFEMWGLSGQAGAAAFQRISGAMEETGLLTYGLTTLFPNGLAFVDTKGRVNVWSGALRVISTPPVEVAVAQSDPQRMFYYSMRGHEFLCVTFRDAPAWCYDVATGEWHERAEGAEAPWTVAATVEIGQQWYCATASGKVATMTERCVDFGQPMVRTAVSLPVSPGKPFIVSELAVYPQTGVYTQSDVDFVLDDGDVFLSLDGFNPLGWAEDDGAAVITLATTRDGVAFGPEKEKGLGAVGKRQTWVNWRNLGQFRRMAAFRTRLSCPNDIPLLSAAEVEIVA